MIDAKLRQALSQDLRRLVTGRMTNDELEDDYFERFATSSDRAIECIAAFGCDLFSSDLLRPYHLKGRYAVDRATRRTVARCVLFLRTDREYDWPQGPYSMGILRMTSCIAGLGLTVGCAFGICFLLMLAMVSTTRDIALVWPLVMFWPLGAIGLASFIFSVWYLFMGGHRRILRRSTQWRAWLRHGDFDAWPFRWREDLYQVRRTHLLFSAGSAVES